ncbi:MAG: GNAT family N-acetyltransferase [Rubripirellula sp.]
MNVTTKRVNYRDADDSQQLVRLMKEYVELEGVKQPDLKLLPEKLADFPTAFSVLAYADSNPSQAVGLIDCFYGFSTWKLKPLVNIHDVIVTKDFRGRGVAGVLLSAVEEIAIANGCCRMTLEVYANNERAVRAYQNYGFTGDPSCPGVDTLFLRKSFENE